MADKNNNPVRTAKEEYDKANEELRKAIDQADKVLEEVERKLADLTDQSKKGGAKAR